MIKKIDKTTVRRKRQKRIREKISGTSSVPRMSVFRSSKHIYVQLIDDVSSNTLVACSTVEKDIATKVNNMNKKEASKFVGAEVAKKALEKGITKIVFDRGGFLYSGRVAEVAEGARGAGLEF